MKIDDCTKTYALVFSGLRGQYCASRAENRLLDDKENRQTVWPNLALSA